MPIKRKTKKAKRKVVYRKVKGVAAYRRSSRRLSQGFTRAGIQSALMDAAQGAIGGVVASFIANQKFLDAQSETNKGLLLAGLAVVTGTMLKRPAIAAGMGAVAGTKLLSGLGVGSMVGLGENGGMFPISQGLVGSTPYGLMEAGADYAGLSENIYASNYANTY